MKSFHGKFAELDAHTPTFHIPEKTPAFLNPRKAGGLCVER
jgi:hypothetical protein